MTVPISNAWVGSNGLEEQYLVNMCLSTTYIRWVLLSSSVIRLLSPQSENMIMWSFLHWCGKFKARWFAQSRRWAQSTWEMDAWHLEYSYIYRRLQWLCCCLWTELLSMIVTAERQHSTVFKCTYMCDPSRWWCICDSQTDRYCCLAGRRIGCYRH
jgi:hypothetical protein